MDALVVDILHEFEVGVWKRLYVHLIRLLEAFNNHQRTTLTGELDLRQVSFHTETAMVLNGLLVYRYRLTPTFGRDSIRKFGVNASEMKRRAARDFADLLQVKSEFT